MKIPKTLIIIGVVIIIIIAALYMIPAYDWDEGAPEASINILIERGETTYSGIIDVKPTNIINSMAVLPLTTLNADVAPIEPLGVYKITFSIGVKTLGNVAESYTTSINIVGHNNKTSYPVSGLTGPREYSLTAFGSVRTSTLTQASEYNVVKTFVMPSFLGAFKSSNTGDAREIQGEIVDGSTFLINIESRAVSGSYGLTSAILKVSVGAGGSLIVSIDNITTEVK
jgi:hypothetical protein